MLKSSFEFEVLINGHSAKEYYHKGRNYIEGREDSKFSLRMRNNSGHRVLFVPSVDGLSIMNGKEASFKSKGYIVDAYDSLTIDGWRTSDDKVAEFFFSKPKESYGAKMDRGNNLGIIGCAVFKEKNKKYEQPITIIQKIIEKVPCQCHHHYPQWGTICISCNSGSGIGGGLVNTAGLANSGSLPNSSSLSFATSIKGSNALNMSVSSSKAVNIPDSFSSTEPGLGAGFGKDKYSPVVTVDFDKEETPVEVFSILYDTRKNLEELGIEFKKPVYVSPSAFPNEDGYCQRPD